MAIEFTYQNSAYRLALKYGWFFTNKQFKLSEGRELCRVAMTNAILNNAQSMVGDLKFFQEDPAAPNREFTWRMCSVFVTKLNADSKEVETVFGPFTSVCVPGDQFNYAEARGRAIGIMKDQAIQLYAAAKQANEECPIFHIAIEAFLAWTKRNNKKKVRS